MGITNTQAIIGLTLLLSILLPLLWYAYKESLDGNKYCCGTIDSGSGLEEYLLWVKSLGYAVTDYGRTDFCHVPLGLSKHYVNLMRVGMDGFYIDKGMYSIDVDFVWTLYKLEMPVNGKGEAALTKTDPANYVMWFTS